MRATRAWRRPSVAEVEIGASSEHRAAGAGPERGSASVESAGLAALVALLLIAAIAAVSAGGEVDAGRDLAGTLGRRLAC